MARDLLLVIFALTVKILGQREFCGGPGLKERLRHLRERNSLESKTSASRWSLDDFRQACLLAYYEFHEHPGESAWLRVGNLTRKAYYCGLHQLDNHDLCDDNDDDDDDKDEWRYVWWCIFCLDSYSNVTSASPFVVHVESIRTSLITNSGRERARKAQIFLPGQPEMFWQTVEAIKSHGHNVNFNLHIITTAILREAATLYRLWWQNPSDRLQDRLTALEHHLTEIRLALPPRYLNIARDALHEESHHAYHARLICALHLHISRLVICLPLLLQRSKEERQDIWYKTLEYCQDIVAVVKQWDNQHSPSVDPAVCFIIYTALVILHLHYNSMSSSGAVRLARVKTQENILRLFLEQFATFWYLPRLLISKQTHNPGMVVLYLIKQNAVTFDKFSLVSHEAVGRKDAMAVLKYFQAPLHCGWLKFLDPEHGFLSLFAAEEIGQTFMEQSWDFNNWQAAFEVSYQGC